MIVVVAATILGIGPNSAHAFVSAPYNGGFDGSAAGWTGNGYWTGSEGYPSSGALAISTGDAQSLVIRASGTWSLVFYAKGTYTNTVSIDVVDDDTSQVDWTLDLQFVQTGAWQVATYSGFTSGNYYLVVSSGDNSLVYVDGIEASGPVIGDTPGGTPTPTPTGTPNPTVTPTGTPVPNPTGISMSNASARVTVTGATPYFSKSAFNSPKIPIDVSGTNTDQTHIWNLSMSRKDLGFCLPDVVDDVFGGVELCYSIPMISIDAMEILGVDLVPTLTLVSTVLFLVFIVKMLQGR